MNSLFFWFLFTLLLYLSYRLGAQHRTRAREVKPLPLLEIPSQAFEHFSARVSPWMEISRQRAAHGLIEFVGRLRGDAEDAWGRIRQTFAADRITPMLLEGDGREVRLLLLPAKVKGDETARPRWWLHVGLFLATLLTTTWAGALHAGVNLLEQPEKFSVGLPYALGLLLILGAHELGHYFTAKAHGIQVTPPYFIPVPFALGTFGAFIKIKSLTPNRRALLDVAVAGPLAGLVLAIPALLIGLRHSHIVAGNASGALGLLGVNVGSSVLMACLTKISLGASVLQGQHLLLHPLAFAGWLGLVVTALNLLPIGQLDGGHIAHALVGSRNARTVSVLSLAGLFLLALFVWPGLLFWALVVLFIAGTRDMPAADDITPVNLPRKALGYIALSLLLLIVVPVPPALYQAIDILGPGSREGVQHHTIIHPSTPEPRSGQVWASNGTRYLGIRTAASPIDEVIRTCLSQPLGRSHHDRRCRLGRRRRGYAWTGKGDRTGRQVRGRTDQQKHDRGLAGRAGVQETRQGSVRRDQDPEV